METDRERAARLREAGRGPAPTVEEIRDGIDKGRAGDKVRHPDPAAAPLGSDDEAAGHPPSAEARRQELGRQGSATPDHGREETRRGFGKLLIWIAVLTVLALPVLLLALR